MKKFGKLLKLVFVGAAWTYVFLMLFHFICSFIWHFDIFSRSDWQIISNFWNSGGKIKSGTDFLFVLSFIAAFALWSWGWKKLYRTKISEILALPFKWHDERVLKKYGGGTRIVLHNIGTKSEEPDQKQIIAQKLKDFEKKLDEEKETSKIRENIAGKIRSEK